MDKIFETNSSFHVKQRTTGKVQYYCSDVFANINKILTLGGKLSTKL